MASDDWLTEGEGRHSARSFRSPRSRPRPGADPAQDTDWREEDYEWHPTALIATRVPERLSDRITSTSSLLRTSTATRPVLGSGHPEEGSRGRAGAKCQVEGCRSDLSVLREYHQRYKICEDHLKQHSLVRNGRRQRFCQQCGRFHDLTEFDGEKRSCRTRLQRHNARRRKRGGANGLGGQLQRPGRKKPKSRQQQGDNTDEEEEEEEAESGSKHDSMAEADSRLVETSSLAQAALNSMQNIYGRSDSKESASTHVVQPTHASLQELFQAQALSLAPSLPASNQPLRSYLPNVGFATADIPLYVGKPVSELADVGPEQGRGSSSQQSNPFASVVENFAGQQISSKGSDGDAVPTLFNPVDVPGASPHTLAEPLSSQSSFNPYSAPRPYIALADPTASELLAHQAHEESGACLQSENSGFLCPSNSGISSEAHKLVQEAVALRPYQSEDQIFRASLKLPGTPADLWPELGRSLHDMMGSPEGYLRRGCVQMTVDAIVSQERHSELSQMDPVRVAQTLLTKSRTSDAQLQWGDKVVKYRSDICAVQQNEIKVFISPAAVLASAPAALTISGSNLAADDVHVLVRSRGRYLKASILAAAAPFSWTVKLTECVAVGYIQLELLSRGVLSPAQVVLALPSADAVQEVNERLCSTDFASRRDFFFDVGRVLRAQGRTPANLDNRKAELACIRVAEVARRLVPYAARHGMAALSRLLLPLLTVASSTASAAVAALEAEHLPVGTSLLHVAVVSGRCEMVAVLLEWCTANHLELRGSSATPCGLSPAHVSTLVPDAAAMMDALSALCLDAAVMWQFPTWLGWTPAQLATFMAQASFASQLRLIDLSRERHSSLQSLLQHPGVTGWSRFAMCNRFLALYCYLSTCVARGACRIVSCGQLSLRLASSFLQSQLGFADSMLALNAGPALST